MTALAAKEAKPAHAARGMRRSTLRPIGAENQTQKRAIRQLIQTDGIQAKLAIGKPNDAYEQEADRVADHVVSGQMAPAISTIPSGGLSSSGTSHNSHQLQSETDNKEQIQEKEIQREEDEELAQAKLIQRQSEEEDEPVQAKFIRRQIEEEEEPVQAKFIQRQAEEEEEPVQAKFIQRQAEEEEEPIQAKGSPPSSVLASQAIQQKSSGSPIRPDIRNILESNMGADLSGVRVHEDSAAHAAVASVSAKAFTHKSDIWLGEGQSQSDVHLMAHEATHTVQQGATSAQRGNISQTGGGKVQRSWLGNAWNSVTSAVSDAASFVADSVGAAVNYIKGRAAEFVQGIPGYSLFTVIMARDPITGQTVARNGRNFIEAGLDVIPNGGALKQKLEEEGKLAEAAQWLDEQINTLDISPTEIGAQLTRFWGDLQISDVANLGAVLNRLSNIFRGPIGRIITFAENVARRLLQIIKDAVISSLINFIRTQTRAYPLLTTILGRDPVSGEVVERTPMALLRGFMQLSESGATQLAQMEESGSLQRAADWLNRAVARLNLSWEMLVNGFREIWDGLGIQSLLNPLGVFRQIYDTFAAPVGRIINFLVEVAAKVLGFIKDALISRLITYARTIRGYPLLTVILGKDPFSEELVERNAENIIHGFMSLMDGGEEQFQEMKQTGAIARMTDRIEGAIATLNFTWEYIRGLFLTAWNAFSLADLAAPLAAFGRLLAIFGAPLLRLVGFIVTVVRMVIEVALQLMNFPVALISNIITRSMQAFDNIKRDPIGFLKNLLLAVKTGFVKFFSNIATHLLNGLTGWLFGELEDAGISPPPDLSFQSILGLVIQVLGISVERIFQKLADRIGQERVDRIRGMMDRLTGIWTFVSDVMTRGPVAIWEYIQERLSNLWSTVLEAVRNWVVTRIIQQVTARLLSMLDPTGIMAVVNGFIAFYSAVQSFVRYLTEMLEVVNSFVEGVAEIAAGSVESAANFLESALGRAMPIVIGFLANQVGLSGLGRRIGEMIERVQAMVDQGLDWLIDRAVSAGTSFMDMIGLGGSGEAEPEDVANMDPDQRKEAARNDVEGFLLTGPTGEQLAVKLAEVKQTFSLENVRVNRSNEEHPVIEYINSPGITTRLDRNDDGAIVEGSVQGGLNMRYSGNESKKTPYQVVKENFPMRINESAFKVKAERWQRPGTAIAEIMGERPSGSRPSVIGTSGKIGGDEHKIKTGRYRSYDGGHLIGLKLIGEHANDSRNLAPQIGSFNRGTYLQIEKMMDNSPVNSAGIQDKNVAVNVEVTISHSSDYEVPETALVERGIIGPQSDSDESSKTVRIPSRIPNRWRMKVEVNNDNYTLQERPLTAGTRMEQRFQGTQPSGSELINRGDQFVWYKVGQNQGGQSGNSIGGQRQLIIETLQETP